MGHAFGPEIKYKMSEAEVVYVAKAISSCSMYYRIEFSESLLISSQKILQYVIYIFIIKCTLYSAFRRKEDI
jgi:hypothetical protein